MPDKLSEKDIETYLVEQVKKVGGIAYKFTSPQRRNVPDRICVFPGGRLVFVEVKAPGKRPTKGQEREMQRLRDRGQMVEWVQSKEQVLFLL